MMIVNNQLSYLEAKPFYLDDDSTVQNASHRRLTVPPTDTPSLQQPPREQARLLPCIRRQQNRRPSRGGGHVRRLRRTGAHRGGVPDARAKLEPHERVAVRLLQRHPRSRHRVRTRQEKYVHQDLRIGKRCVARPSEDVLEAVSSRP